MREKGQRFFVSGVKLVNKEPAPRPVTVSQPPAQEFTLGELFFNFKKATSKWKENGYPVVSKSSYIQRRSKCKACPQHYWDGKARFGLGKCSAPGCGCTKLKLFLATERCPIGEWEPEI